MLVDCGCNLLVASAHEGAEVLSSSLLELEVTAFELQPIAGEQVDLNFRQDVVS